MYFTNGRALLVASHEKTHSVRTWGWRMRFLVSRRGQTALLREASAQNALLREVLFVPMSNLGLFRWINTYGVANPRYTSPAATEPSGSPR